MTAGASLLRAQRPILEVGEAPLGLDEYQTFTKSSDITKLDGAAGLDFALLGLFGETGSLLSELKKKQRDREVYLAYRDAVIEEFGDVLWYFANAAERAGLSLSGIAARATNTTGAWAYRGRRDPQTFRALQALHVGDAEPSSAEEQRGLVALAGQVGRLMDDLARGRIDTDGDVLAASMVELFRSLVSAADGANVSLDESANGNIVKALGRWPLQRKWPALFDEEYESHEQLPREIAMTFKERKVGGREYVVQSCNGIRIGDQLTDNKVERDDYRFHDAFHLAYAAILGWSPVLRAQFKTKRKSNPSVDENEDGARAILIEEGISTWVFNHGMRRNSFEDSNRVDYPLLKAIQELVRGYEVASRPPWLWEHAILEGFKAFRQLRLHRGGVVIANLDRRTLDYQANP